MDITDDDISQESWRRPVMAGLAALGIVLGAVAVVGFATAVEQAARPPTCNGIGFGCTPDAATTALLVGGIYGLPAVAGAWVVSWIGWAVTRRRSELANLTATWLPVWALAVGVGILVLAAASAFG